MMDAHDTPDVPARLREQTRASHRREPGAAPALARRGRAAASASRSRRGSPSPARATCSKRSARVSAARGACSCTPTPRSRATRWPTSASATGLNNMAYLAATGLASPRLCAAHCVWVDEHEQAVMAERDVKVLHCPGSNLKLGSGLAPVVELRRARHQRVARRRRRRLQQPARACSTRCGWRRRCRPSGSGPGALTARDVVWMATREGARALGLDGGDRQPRSRQARRLRRRRTATRRTWRPAATPTRRWSTRRRGTTSATVVVDGERARGRRAAGRGSTGRRDRARGPRASRDARGARRCVTRPDAIIPVSTRPAGLLSSAGEVV